MRVIFLGNKSSSLSNERFNILNSFDFVKEIYYMDIVKEEKLLKKIISYFNKLIILNYLILFKKYDYVIYHGAYHFILSLICSKKTKVIVIVQGSEINEQYKKQVKFFVKKLLYRSNLIITRSLNMKKNIINKISRIEKKIEIINWGINDVYFASNIKKYDDKITIISYRATGKIYNIDLIFNVIEKLKLKYHNINFIYVEYNKDYMVNLNLDIVDEYYKTMTKQQLASILAKVDISLSIPTYDGFSNSILESLASGCYPLISNIDAYSLVFPNDDKLLRKINVEFDSFYKSLEDLIHNIDIVRGNKIYRREFAKSNYDRKNQIDILKQRIINI
ncbi:glycosyltransferase family protein [Aliarcobacter butzleri]|uniref:hypothetical protein n=1 Tax=Aliarcobacter butzleri TaxID=28197 RepID=UPI002B250301|nr:hypothetical protein [Aliarcobacter butzleri]